MGAVKRALEAIDRLYSEVDRLEQENKRLQAIVDKLPSTADGVPVVPGMVLYTESVWEVKTALMLKGGSQPTRGDPWLQLYTGNYYSTRKAAEAEAAKSHRGC